MAQPLALLALVAGACSPAVAHVLACHARLDCSQTQSSSAADSSARTDFAAARALLDEARRAHGSVDRETARAQAAEAVDAISRAFEAERSEVLGRLQEVAALAGG